MPLEVTEVTNDDLLVHRVLGMVRDVPGVPLSFRLGAVPGMVPLGVAVEALVVADLVDVYRFVPIVFLGLLVVEVRLSRLLTAPMLRA